MNMRPLIAESPVAMLNGHQAPVRLVAYSSDGRLLASADTDRQLKVWEQGRLVFQRNLRSWHNRYRSLDWIRSLAFSADSSCLYAASGDTVKAYDVRSDRPLWEHG